MALGRTVVLDIGKSLAKLSLWRADGTLVERRTRANARLDTGAYVALDAEGIEAWMAEVLSEFATLGPVDAIIPVGHGAAAAIIKDGRLACPPIDYEEPLSAADRAAYVEGRDPFAQTGSPSLPDGLNLGAQLHRLEGLHPDLFTGDAQILPWPQFWAWRLSGVAASEATSLGCHSDLWRPLAAEPSEMARRRGWAARFAPLRHAGEALGPISPEWAACTGLSNTTQIHVGLHDSNAALLAARGFGEIADHEATVLSTGTWFVAMRSPAPGATVDVAALSEDRDCLINVDAYGTPIPSGRFMGGREIELLTGIDSRRIDIAPDQPALVAAVPAVIAAGAMVLPTMTPGVGPFAHGRGRWTAMPDDPFARRAAVSLYAALVAATTLELVGTRERLLVEGRFAEAEVFVRGLATLRPDLQVFVSNAHNDVSYGALRLLDPDLAPQTALRAVTPLDVDLGDYAARWRREADRLVDAA